MAINRRVFVSMPADRWLTPAQNELKWAIVQKIETSGYTTEIFFDPRGKSSLCANKAWSAHDAEYVARRCVGSAIIGMARWTFNDSGAQVRLPTEYNHYEGAVSFTLRLPMLVLIRSDLRRRVVFDDSYNGYVAEFPTDAGRDWLKSEQFRMPFKLWKNQLSKRRDVFMGYCSSSVATARKLKRYLSEKIGVTVLDWKTDFLPGRTILQQIEEACERCSAGIFLFTQADKIKAVGKKNQAIPRDNVVFEAGYFISAKGKDHVLIVREKNTKMPADLGGDIYASLEDTSDISPIKQTISSFMSGL